jgi:xylulokinase
MGSSVAGEMLEWFRREYGFEAAQKAQAEGGVDWDFLLQTAAASPPGANGVMFLPHLSGTHFPIVDPNSMGAFIGLRSATTKGDMLRAVIEGLSYQYRQILDGLEQGFGQRADKLVAVGGSTRNSFVMQNKADIAGKPIECPELEEATPLGAAILAGIGIGLYKDEQDAFEHVRKPSRVYEPNPSVFASYAGRYRVFEQLYPGLRDLNRQLQTTR